MKINAERQRIIGIFSKGEGRSLFGVGCGEEVSSQ